MATSLLFLRNSPSGLLGQPGQSYLPILPLEAGIAAALSKHTLEPEIRGWMAPGRHHGNCSIELAYDLKVGADFERLVPQAVPWQRLCMLALSKLNASTVEAILREALAPDAKENLAELEVREQVEAAVTKLTESTRRKQHGQVTGSVVTHVTAVHSLGSLVTPATTSADLPDSIAPLEPSGGAA